MEQEPTRDESLDRPLPLWYMLMIPVWVVGFLALPLFLAAGGWR